MSTPFFRGQNRMDWLYAAMLQTAVDYYDVSYMQTVANILSPSRVTFIPQSSGLIPRCAIVVTDSLVLFVSASTKGFAQWLANVLGSAAAPAPPAHGLVSAYFGAVAQAQFAAALPFISEALPGRQLVLIGFSLGGASVTIQKDMWAQQFSQGCACVAFGNPRAGTVSFVDGYDPTNYAGFGLVNDPVPSVPPVVWTSLGSYNGTFPNPPLVVYAQNVPGATLGVDGSISFGYQAQGLDEVLVSLADGTAVKFHIQDQYAKALRSQEIPDRIPDGFQGYENASQLDSIASELFYWTSPPWPWPHDGSNVPDAIEERFSDMPCQVAIYIRDTSGVPAGFQETYYLSNSDPDACIAAMTVNPGGSSPISIRQSFLSNSCAIYALRASFVGSPKKSSLIKYPQVLTGLMGPTDQIRTSLAYLGYNGAKDTKRQFHFRGIDKTVCNGDQLSNAAAASLATQGIDRFLTAMMTAGMVLRANGTTIGNAIKINGAVKANQGDPITLNLATTSPFNSGDLVVVNGCKANPLLNGQWKVLTTTPNTSVILAGSQNYSAPPNLAGGIRPFTLITPSLATWQFNAVSSHDTGRPSFLPRGRQSARIRHR